jgi:hypothetical protein
LFSGGVSGQAALCKPGLGLGVKTSNCGGLYCFFGCVGLTSIGSLWGTCFFFALDFMTLLAENNLWLEPEYHFDVRPKT